MTRTALKALSLAMATLALQTQAVAAPTAEQLNSIKLYSDVTIAQDSVTGWGPWTEFEPPAAGSPPLNLPPATSDLYRTLPQLPDRELLGFGTFYTVLNNDTPVSSGAANAIILNGTALSPTSAGKLLPDSFELRLNAITGTYSPPNTVRLTLQADGTYQYASNQEFVKMTLFASPDAPTDAPSPVTFQQLVHYISGRDAEGNPVAQGTVVTGPIGYTTPVADIAALRRGNVVATYNGHSLLNALNEGVEGKVAPMTMTVNFGQSSWSGTWNNGVDANGAVGFSAAGTISGARFNSAPGSITALDSNNISGSVRGAFYGAQAAAVGGIADITKNNVRRVDPFIAFKQPAITPTPGTPTGGSQ
ncbi:MAG: hypothetical protein EOP36_18925 [Rubrivivax sp.]|nr:MAG: hypothetical protein EOP36_18925 [Rubrivivax sp.]